MLRIIGLLGMACLTRYDHSKVSKPYCTVAYVGKIKIFFCITGLHGSTCLYSWICSHSSIWLSMSMRRRTPLALLPSLSFLLSPPLCLSPRKVLSTAAAQVTDKLNNYTKSSWELHCLQHNLCFKIPSCWFLRSAWCIVVHVCFEVHIPSARSHDILYALAGTCETP